DVLVLATHPDDAESTCGGTIAKLVERGASVGVLDSCRGEMGTRGTPRTRARECAAATRELRLAFRGNLGLADGRIVPTVEAREAIARWIRRLRPMLFIAPWRRDLHPDHAAVGVMARQAYFLAGLRRLAPELAPHRPKRVLYYPSHDLFRVSFVSVLEERHFQAKLRALACYRSQLEPAGPGDRGAHFIHRQDLRQRIEIRARFFGALATVRWGEPFRAEGALPDVDPLSIPSREAGGG
ncbi:MAG TPA: bacillithiol biosynthesis deacetylase BshB1, partial [Planctomycetota bacterium]|nr:bacillithiol biosynthesis deacetylase BshB1 [Planctomycetota bacterium]